MIPPINASLYMRIFSLYVQILARLRLLQQLEDWDNEFFDRNLLINHQLIVAIINLLRIIKLYMGKKDKANKARLVKPHLLMHLLRGYRFVHFRV